MDGVRSPDFGSEPADDRSRQVTTHTATLAIGFFSMLPSQVVERIIGLTPQRTRLALRHVCRGFYSMCSIHFPADSARQVTGDAIFELFDSAIQDASWVHSLSDFSKVWERYFERYAKGSRMEQFKAFQQSPSRVLLLFHEVAECIKSEDKRVR